MNCKDCKWYRSSEDKAHWGKCYNQPPVHNIEYGIWVRPNIHKNDICSKFENIKNKKERIYTETKLEPLKSPHCKKSIEDIKF